MRWSQHCLPVLLSTSLASHPVQSSLTSRHQQTVRGPGQGEEMWHPPPPPHTQHQEQYRSHHSKSLHTTVIHTTPHHTTPNHYCIAIKCSPSHTISIFSSSFPSLGLGVCWVTNILLRRSDQVGNGKENRFQ